MAACPKGHDSGADDYCDVCGTPMAAGPPNPTPPPPPPSTASPCPACAAPLAGRFCESCGQDSLAPLPDPGRSTPPIHGDQPVGARSWWVVATADREYFDRVRAMDGPDAATIEFPLFVLERRFPLADRQVLIGRRSRSRGIHPEIDLIGPPEDAAVSHTHALLVPQSGGGWAVVDLRSTNHTYLNGDPDPIAAEAPIALGDGSHLNLGAWTRLTLRTEDA